MAHLPPALLLILACINAQTSAVQVPAIVTKLARGSALRVASDLSGGLAMENWKIRLSTNTNETALQALTNLGKYQVRVLLIYVPLAAP